MKIAICAALYESGRPFLGGFVAALRSAVAGRDALFVAAIDGLHNPKEALAGLAEHLDVVTTDVPAGHTPAGVRRAMLAAGQSSGADVLVFTDMDDLIAPRGLHSHLDALAHLASHGELYNGYPESSFSKEDGASKLGIENMRGGIVTRGVLIDVPWLKNVPYLEPSTAITLEDIKAWEERTGEKIQEGDVVLIRTGREAREAEHGLWKVQSGTAGPHPEVATLLHERGVAVLGSDVANEIYPSVVPDNSGPMHLLAINSMGMPLFDNLGLEAVAREARERERWTFLFVAAPLPVRHATGSAVNPLAIF